MLLYNVRQHASLAGKALTNVRIQDFMDEINPALNTHSCKKNGGARRDRTDDLMLAKHALSQLSYGPGELKLKSASASLMKWWAWEDLNLRPHAYQARALTN